MIALNRQMHVGVNHSSKQLYQFVSGWYDEGGLADRFFVMFRDT